MLIAPDLPLSPDAGRRGRPVPVRRGAPTEEGWAKWNRHYWLRDWPGFLDFFFSQTFTEPHSTKQIEDAIGWGLDTTRRPSSGAWTWNG